MTGSHAAPRAWALDPRPALARRILASVVARVPVDVVLPSGDRLDGGGRGAGRPVLELVEPEAVFRRLARHPKIGIGEAYTTGEWRPAPGTDLADLLVPFAERLDSAVPAPLRRLRRLVDRRIPRSQRNSASGSRRNVRAHYDLGNELFEAFLDPTMSYSSARFDDRRPWADQSLERAQARKMEAVLDLASARTGTRLLEIGTGWGALAIAAARRGCRVTTITLSHEQAVLARTRVAEAGLDQLVDVRLQDYREVSGTYDAIVSVEMIEAVGEEFWPTYFATLDERLAPGGRAVLQAILMPHERYLQTRNSWGWIQKHIFPGGLIPSVAAIDETVRAHTRLHVERVDGFGAHYAETLRRWREAFLAADLDVDDEFRRTWEFYLAYSEAGFRADYLDVAHLVLQHDPATSTALVGADAAAV